MAYCCVSTWPCTALKTTTPSGPITATPSVGVTWSTRFASAPCTVWLPNNMVAIRKVLEAARVLLIDRNKSGGAGVRLRE
jgi:hypothetical protein